jgi:hypothetical protein
MATLACLTSLDPYILVTDERAIAYTAQYTTQASVPYGRFEPSKLNRCMFNFTVTEAGSYTRPLLTST